MKKEKDKIFWKENSVILFDIREIGNIFLDTSKVTGIDQITEKFNRETEPPIIAIDSPYSLLIKFAAFSECNIAQVKPLVKNTTNNRSSELQ